MISKMVIALPDTAATERLAAACASALPQNFCIWLEGELGAGKTTFAMGFLRALGWQGSVKSPTYTLLEPYTLLNTGLGSTHINCNNGSSSTQLEPEKKLESAPSLCVYHFDLYRMISPEEWVDAGFDDLPSPALRLIEWPECAAGACTRPDWRLRLVTVGEGREASVETCTAEGESAWRTVEQNLEFQARAG